MDNTLHRYVYIMKFFSMLGAILTIIGQKDADFQTGHSYTNGPRSINYSKIRIIRSPLGLSKSDLRLLLDSPNNGLL